jgi:hypothetical protein
MALDTACECVRASTEERDALVVAAQNERQRIPVRMALMDRGQGLVHVLRPAILSGRHTKREEHVCSVPEFPQLLLRYQTVEMRTHVQCRVIVSVRGYTGMNMSIPGMLRHWKRCRILRGWTPFLDKSSSTAWSGSPEFS